MAKTKQEVKEEIVAYIEKHGGVYSNWYVGIASDVRKRLFTDHQVDEKNGAWIYDECMSSNSARDVEDYFINDKGTKGGPGGGDDDTTWVYAYKITSSTAE